MLCIRARFVKSSGNKIRGFIADLELFLQMCGRPVHHWDFFLLASLGTEEAEKVRRSHVAVCHRLPHIQDGRRNVVREV